MGNAKKVTELYAKRLTCPKWGLSLSLFSLSLKNGMTENRTIVIYYNDLEGNKYFTEMQKNFQGPGWTFLWTKQDINVESNIDKKKIVVPEDIIDNS